MRHESHIAMREDRQLIVLTHLSQLIPLAIGFGSLLLPLILWVVNKDKVYKMDEHGKRILNFQISMLIFCLISIPLIFIGIGVLILIGIALISIIMPIVNAIKASNGEIPNYPLSIEFLK